jgi:hypothetical protein
VPEPETPPSWTVPAVIVGAIALLAAGGVFFALQQVESDAEHEATKPVPVVQQPGATTTTATPGDVASWPDGQSAYTVVLATAPDEASAQARAAAAVKSGVPAGVLDSDRYPTLEPGEWVLFAGRFESRAEAIAEAARYAGSGFPDAQANFVSPRKVPGA